MGVQPGRSVQSQFGIQPYRAFMGALPVRDAVDIGADAELPEPAGIPGAPS